MHGSERNKLLTFVKNIIESIIENNIVARVVRSEFTGNKKERWKRKPSLFLFILNYKNFIKKWMNHRHFCKKMVFYM